MTPDGCFEEHLTSAMHRNEWLCQCSVNNVELTPVL